MSVSITARDILEVHITVPPALFFPREGAFGGAGEQYAVALAGPQFVSVCKWWGDPAVAKKRTRKPWGWFTGNLHARRRFY